ncbi:MAG: hypothetical protein ACREM1_21635, partial [Longimicrobiales bacterium]
SSELSALDILVKPLGRWLSAADSFRSRRRQICQWAPQMPRFAVAGGANGKIGIYEILVQVLTENCRVLL